MGRPRTAAAKKYIEKAPSSSDEDEKLADLKRTKRTPKKSPLNNTKKSPPKKNKPSPRNSSGRSTRNTRNTDNDKENGKRSIPDSTPSSDSEEDAPNVSRNSNDRSTRNTRNTDNDKENGKRSIPDSTPSSDSEDEAPVVNHKRKTSTVTSPKKPKQTPSTSKKIGKPKKQEKAAEERYEVEAILEHKFEDNNKYFLIRWKGYDSSVDSWETSRNISCPALLAKYYEEHPEAAMSAKNANKKRKKKVLHIPRQLKIDEQLDYDTEGWDENEDYEVERILDVHVHRDNKRDFLIRWKGYSSKSDSWEPEDNLDCADLIDKFMGKVDQLKNLSLKELRPVRTQTNRFTLMTQASARRLSKRNFGRQRAVYHDCDD